MTSWFRALLRPLGAAERAACALSSALLATERAFVVLVAFDVVHDERARGLLGSAILVAVLTARSGLRAVLGVRVQERLHAAAVLALLDGDVLRNTAEPEVDAHTAILEGTYSAVQLILDFVVALVGDAAVAITLVILIASTQSPSVIGAAILLLVVGGAVLFGVRALTGRMSERAWEAYAPVSDDLGTVLGGRLEIVAGGVRGVIGEIVTKHLARWRAVSLRADTVSSLVARAPLVSALAVAVLLIGNDALRRSTLGGIGLAEATLIGSALPAFLGIAQSVYGIARYRARVRPLADLLETERAPTGSVKALFTFPVAVEWRDVTFAYPSAEGGTGRAALSHFNLSWSPGQTLLITGANGAGKSTVLRMLLGLGMPKPGRIRIGDTDLRDLDLDAWRAQIAYLPQRPFLSDRATVREAIHLLAPGASDGAMRAELERAGVWSALAASSADPLAVRIGTLSVGQRQRVALARVLVKDAPILLLDEPDANLDAAGIRTVREIVRELAPRKMIAIVAHTDELVDLGGTVVRLAAPA